MKAINIVITCNVAATIFYLAVSPLPSPRLHKSVRAVSGHSGHAPQKRCYDPPPNLITSVIMTTQTQGVCNQELPKTVDLKM